MDKELLRYPLKSHRKTIKFPEDCPDLAEFMGILAGDGGLNNQWQISITMNSAADAQYVQHVRRLVETLFGIRIKQMERERNTLRLLCNSAEMVDFVILKGFTHGHKVNNQISFPTWVSKNSSFEKAFVRGLIDTDGCLFIHRHTVSGKKYRNIGLNFSNHAVSLINGVARAFSKQGIEPHIARNRRSIYLYKEESVVKYLSIFGSSNPRITGKYEKWRGVRVV